MFAIAWHRLGLSTFDVKLSSEVTLVDENWKGNVMWTGEQHLCGSADDDGSREWQKVENTEWNALHTDNEPWTTEIRSTTKTVHRPTAGGMKCAHRLQWLSGIHNKLPLTVWPCSDGLQVARLHAHQPSSLKRCIAAAAADKFSLATMDSQWWYVSAVNATK